MSRVIFITNDWCQIQPGPAGLDPADERAMPAGCEPMTLEAAMAHVADEAAVQSRLPAGQGRSPTAPGGTRSVSKPGLEALAQSAAATADSFRDQVVTMLTVERAAAVRRWRVDERLTWRALARRASEEWADAYAWQPWEPASNQLMGVALCRIAALVLGEVGDEPPWNGPAS